MITLHENVITFKIFEPLQSWIFLLMHSNPMPMRDMDSGTKFQLCFITCLNSNALKQLMALLRKILWSAQPFILDILLFLFMGHLTRQPLGFWCPGFPSLEQ